MADVIQHHTSLLTDDMLVRFDERAAAYDRDNRFFDEDWAELVASGYLLAAVPTELGGSGLRLDEVVQLQQRLAYHAAPTALAVNMHVYWTGVAADLSRAGDDSCRWILERAAQGEVFAAIHGEAGNDMPLLLSTTSAERVDGGWRLNGHKIFGSLSPVWTYGGFHAMESGADGTPRIVHGFIPRSAEGVAIIDTWDTFGMRATQSHDTVLHDVFVPDELCPVVCPAGFAGAGLFHVAIFGWALMGFAAVYQGMARRAYDLTVERVPNRTSLALSRSMAYHPEVQHNVADMRIAIDAAQALLDRTCHDWAIGVDDPLWPVRFVATRSFVIDQAIATVGRALDVSGGAASFKRNRLEQLFRDVNMGRFHPGNTLLAHELIGKLCLGIDPDAGPRWG